MGQSQNAPILEQARQIKIAAPDQKTVPNTHPRGPHHLERHLAENILILHCSQYIWDKNLSNFCDSINDLGAYYMLSNADTELTKYIYMNKDRYSTQFLVGRTIASKASNRVNAKEVIITNYEVSNPI